MTTALRGTRENVYELSKRTARKPRVRAGIVGAINTITTSTTSTTPPPVPCTGGSITQVQASDTFIQSCGEVNSITYVNDNDTSSRYQLLNRCSSQEVINPRRWKPLGSGAKHTVLSHDNGTRVLKLSHDQVLHANVLRIRTVTPNENFGKALLMSAKFLFQFLMITNICGGQKMICWSDQPHKLKELILVIATKLKEVSGYHVLAQDIVRDIEKDCESREDLLFDSHLLPDSALIEIDPRQLSDDVIQVSLKKLNGLEERLQDLTKNMPNEASVKPMGALLEHRVIGLLESNAMMAIDPFVKEGVTCLDQVCITIEFKLKSPLPACISKKRLLKKISEDCDTSDIEDAFLFLIHQDLEWTPELTRRSAYYRYGIKHTVQTWSAKIARELLATVREDLGISKDSIHDIFENEDGLSKIFINGEFVGRSVPSKLVSTEFKDEVHKTLNKEKTALSRIIIFTAFSESQHVLACAMIDKLNKSLMGKHNEYNESIEEKLKSYRFNQKALEAFNWKDYKNCEELMVDHALDGIRALSRLDKAEVVNDYPSEEINKALEWLSRYRHGKTFSDCSVILSVEKDGFNVTLPTKVSIVDLDFKEINGNQKILRDMNSMFDGFRSM